MDDLPQFPTGDMSTEDYLVKRAKEGLEERLAFLFPDEEERLKRRPEYDERLETELQVINQMGFPGYFLINLSGQLQSNQWYCPVRRQRMESASAPLC